MKFTIPSTLQLKHEAMHEEQRRTSLTADKLGKTAECAARTEIVTFAHKLVHHIRNEIKIMYQASALVVHYVRLLMGQATDQRSTI